MFRISHVNSIAKVFKLESSVFNLGYAIKIKILIMDNTSSNSIKVNPFLSKKEA